MSRWRLWILGFLPSAFPLSRLISVYLQNRGEIPLVEVTRPTLFTTLLALVVSAILYRVLKRDASRMLLASSGFWLVFLGYGRVAALLGSHFSETATSLISLVLFLLTLCGVMLLVARWSKGLRSLRSAVSTMAVFILLAPLVQHLFSSFRPSEKSATISQPLPLGGDQTPDIYCIVLDSYGRSDVLRDLYHYDNTPFLKALEAQGFIVPTRSRANYIETILAIPALLNLDYIDHIHLAGNTLPSAPDWPREAVDQNRMAASLRTRGYQFVAISCGFLLTQARTADILYDPERASTPLAGWSEKLLAPQLTPIESLLLIRTPLSFLDRSAHRQYEKHRKGLRFALESLSATTQLTQPKFVFAHILLPHTPFVFTATGEPITPPHPFSIDSGSDYKAILSPEEYRKQYIEQLKFTNTRILEELTTILRENQRPTVIVLMGDHGPRSTVNWDKVENTDVKEAFGNLMAFHLVTPKDTQRVPQDISPVNALRFVLNTYFDAKIPLLPNRSFLSTVRVHEAHPADITRKVEAVLPH